MILRNLSNSIRKQDWFTVFIEIVIVVVGVFIGIQVSNWNDERKAHERRALVATALVKDLKGTIGVSRNIIYADVNVGLTEWRNAFQRGEQPPPFYFTMQGSDTPPNTLSLLAQGELSDLFDPVTLFDLGFYFSELEGVGRKFIRYVNFVESDILPNLYRDPAVFYTKDGAELIPEYAASMDRISEFSTDMLLMARWAECLVYRIESRRSFESVCRRNGYKLEGMPESEFEP